MGVCNLKIHKLICGSAHLLKTVFTNILLGAQHEMDSVMKKLASSLTMSLGMALNEILHLYVADGTVPGSLAVMVEQYDKGCTSSMIS